MSLPDYLDSPCWEGICLNTECPHAVKEAPSGRFYITMGHPGFNSRANNGEGYATREDALKAFRRYAKL